MAYFFKHGDRPLNDVTVQRAVGREGFGEVYYAVTDGGREIALKYLRDNPEVEPRGVAACMNLKSPNLVSIHDVRKNEDGEYFVVMEYISGPSLRDMLVAEPQGLGAQRAAYLFCEIAKGLAYLHERGIVHRDLKPGNIFYDDGYVKIGDYGLSKFLSVSRHSAQTSSVGTVHYMAPEVGSGNYSKTIDVYALGVILYEMLLGKVPFEGGSMGEVLMKHLTAQPEVDNLPAPFGDVIRKALAKDPQDRYQSAAEMIAPLMEVAGVRDSMRGFDHTQLGAYRRPVPAESPSPSPARRDDQGPRVRRLPQGAPAYADGQRAAGYEPRIPNYSAVERATRRDLAPEAQVGTLRYAGFWIRAAAAFIDVIIVSMGTAILTGGGDGGPFSFIAGIMYEGLLLGLWNGQTLGKRICGIKVIAADGRVCSVERAFGRAFADILSVLTLCIGYIMAAFDREKRALHDRICSTRVVYTVDQTARYEPNKRGRTYAA